MKCCITWQPRETEMEYSSIAPEHIHYTLWNMFAALFFCLFLWFMNSFLHFNEIQFSSQELGQPVHVTHKVAWARLNIKAVFPSVVISIIKVRQSWERLIFTMGITKLVRQHMYVKTSPWTQMTIIHNKWNQNLTVYVFYGVLLHTLHLNRFIRSVLSMYLLFDSFSFIPTTDVLLWYFISRW